MYKFAIGDVVQIKDTPGIWKIQVLVQDAVSLTRTFTRTYWLEEVSCGEWVKIVDPSLLSISEVGTELYG